MTDGQCRATQAVLNPQTRFGDDVVSRINYAQSAERLAELQHVIIDCINELIRKLCRQASIASSSIYEACIVGNTTMNHIFLGYPVEQLGQAPYQAYSVDARDVPPGELGLDMNPVGNIHCVENIAGFVGADTTAVALAVDMDSIEDRVLVVDIGTNGEIVLEPATSSIRQAVRPDRPWKGLASSMAAGRPTGRSRPSWSTATSRWTPSASIPPRSICGSGLIDAVAVLLDLGVVDATGRFAAGDGLRGSLPAAMASRLCESDGQPAFRLTCDGQTGRPDVVLTQRDIREVQLAKGAILAGIRILMDKLGLSGL